MTTIRQLKMTDFAAELVSVKTLVDILRSSTPSARFWATRRSPAYGYSVDCDEVYPGIFIGDMEAAKSKSFLRAAEITHVLNAAEGSTFGMVNTGSHFYQGTRIVYLGLRLADLPNADISRYFLEAANFIENCLKSGGKVLVHCMMGRSRSATLVVAYLMIKEKIRVTTAMRMLRTIRDVRPNDGFLHQLVELDQRLRLQSPEYGRKSEILATQGSSRIK